MLKNKEKRPGPANNGYPHLTVQLQSDLKYPHRLNFYDQPPIEDITLEDFETYALNRLRVLGEIESSFARNRPWNELKSMTITQCANHDLQLDENTAQTRPLDAQRQKDHVGHFVLRLAFCRSEELRRRFVKAELTLFKVRYEGGGEPEKKAFLDSSDFGWEAVSDGDAKELSDKLVAASSSSKVAEATRQNRERYYKVRWTRVPDLVEKRRVFLKAGMAYVAEKDISSIVYQEFQTRLEKALEMTAKALPRLDEDTRIIPILDNLSQGFLAGASSEWGNAPAAGNGSELTADMVDDIARKHYPMCMRNLHDCLRRDRHLKHFGRLQYGNIQDDKFNKEYRYNIRHSFGLEGKRANYAAKSCQQILLADQPGSSDNHGCPYRHFAPENLQTALLAAYSNQGLTSADLPEIMHTVKNGHFHVACTRVYEITHSKQVSKDLLFCPPLFLSYDIQLSSHMSQRKASKTAPNGYNGDTKVDESALQQYQDTEGHFSLVRNFRLADLVTIMNGFCGSLSIFMSAKYLVSRDEDYLWTALVLPVAGLMFDFFDGKIARWRKESSMIGQELDSLADLISFGVAPALLAFTVGLRTYLDTVVLTAFICCGIARLARFNATVALVPKDATGKSKYFEGLPIPSSLALVSAMCYWTKNGWIEGKEGIPYGTVTLWGNQGGNGDIHLVTFVFGAWAAAMISKTLRVPKI
ncbi:hypothetical protein EUX98_g235 [Antrodiella citrinella]|uniref:CDP-diacylglycerol--serine O-phosphatidyltransferase n=1 Tax=Antrodiella citrinella TaxID=2447956 RepID=A0A4V3XJP7_9APHY|nr:hypothetical protein EUX98_g235 [Antrodiella citrinella]